ncbi:MAG TPA: lysophospholipid acyltransferase family protein [Gemmatimonadaceae bacterium]|nr:lysophospholipid acyltransferase family protein [Gemmatimonadaceae bacterium]
MSAPMKLSVPRVRLSESVAPFSGNVRGNATSSAHRALFVMRVALSVVIMTLGSMGMLVVAMVTLFLARRFYAEVIGKCLGIGILRIWGVRYRVHGSPPPGQVVYISNHTSTIDIFLLIALALPRTRFFLSGFLRKFFPIAIVGYLIRIFWTVRQDFPERRRQIFQRADRILRRTGDSVYLSPEGKRVTTGGIGLFNKGSFHLATSLGAPIVPLYLAIPDDTNPGMGYDAKPGTIDVWFLPAIPTSHWTVEDVEKNRDSVRGLYVRVHDAVRAGFAPSKMTITHDTRGRRDAHDWRF